LYNKSEIAVPYFCLTNIVFSFAKIHIYLLGFRFLNNFCCFLVRLVHISYQPNQTGFSKFISTTKGSPYEWTD